MTTFKVFTSRKNERFEKVELVYSAWFWMSGNPKWFCRIWRKNWVVSGCIPYGESFAKNKFEAYRKALADLQSKASS